MRQLRKLWKPSCKKTVAAADEALHDLSSEEEEIETLLIGMFRDLSADQQQRVFEIVAEFYSLAKKSA